MLLGGFLLDACVIADAADGGSRSAGSKVDRQLPCICRIHVQRRIRPDRPSIGIGIVEQGTPDKNTPAAVIHVLVGILADAGKTDRPEETDGSDEAEVSDEPDGKDSGVPSSRFRPP